MYYDSSFANLRGGNGIHECHTEKGQSGAPVFLSSKAMEVIGIHKGKDKNLSKNTFTLVSLSMLKDLQNWIETWKITIKGFEKSEGSFGGMEDIKKENLKLLQEKQAQKEELEKKVQFFKRKFEDSQKQKEETSLKLNNQLEEMKKRAKILENEKDQIKKEVQKRDSA